jgi:hypothetical protein
VGSFHHLDCFFASFFYAGGSTSGSVLNRFPCPLCGVTYSFFDIIHRTFHHAFGSFNDGSPNHLSYSTRSGRKQLLFTFRPAFSSLCHWLLLVPSYLRLEERVRATPPFLPARRDELAFLEERRIVDFFEVVLPPLLRDLEVAWR